MSPTCAVRFDVGEVLINETRELRHLGRLAGHPPTHLLSGVRRGSRAMIPTTPDYRCPGCNALSVAPVGGRDRAAGGGKVERDE